MGRIAVQLLLFVFSELETQKEGKGNQDQAEKVMRIHLCLHLIDKRRVKRKIIVFHAQSIFCTSALTVIKKTALLEGRFSQAVLCFAISATGFLRRNRWCWPSIRKPVKIRSTGYFTR